MRQDITFRSASAGETTISGNLAASFRSGRIRFSETRMDRAVSATQTKPRVKELRLRRKRGSYCRMGYRNDQRASWQFDFISIRGDIPSCSPRSGAVSVILKWPLSIFAES